MGQWEKAKEGFSRGLEADRTCYPRPQDSPFRVMLLYGYAMSCTQLAEWAQVGEAMSQVSGLLEAGSEEHLQALDQAASAFEEAGLWERATEVREQLWGALGEADEERSSEAR